jgi:aminopeptidase YwaD
LPGRSSNQVIASAHYDSTSTDPYNAPGADDDATGCAALLEIARLMADTETDNTLKLVFFSGEEQGLLGSAAYVAQAVVSGDLIKADYQSDMIGYSVAANNQIAAWDHVTDGPGNNLYASGSLYASQLYWQLVIDPSMVYSDHASFWNNGISATMESEPHVQDNPYYHTLDDLPSSLDPAYLRNATAGFLAAVVTEAGIVSGVPSNDAQQAYCYPNPYRPREGSLHLTNLPAQTRFELYNISGERILKRSFSAPSGVGEWDGKLDGGMIPASGVYFFILQGQKGTSKTGKLAIIN